MMMGMGACPICQGNLAYTATMCPHCGHFFGSHGNFGGYLMAVQAEQERRAAEARIRERESSKHLAFVIGVVILLAVGAFFFWKYAPHGSLSPSSTQASQPTQSAETTVQQYYDDINSQNYQAAYILWYPQTASFAHFKSGYASTKHDELTIGSVLAQADGTVKVLVTVVATEKTSSGDTRQRSYMGYYLVGQHDGAWKLLDGVLNPT